ncbi:hypothetical protein KUCAC02_032784 [Chaenocephalus aceratus]|nr:hypothetical protein KUCAC02_032784 [Chaenocephalus aceratus]
MEPLAAAIRADTGVRGFLVPGSGGLRVKLSQYADDTTLLLDRDECLIRSLQIMDDFGRASGSKLNCAKSSVKFFGKWRERMDVPGGLACCPGPIKVLGVSKRAYGLEQFGAQGGTAAMALPPCSKVASGSPGGCRARGCCKEQMLQQHKGVIGKVRADMKGRMERDILKWGQHAALERWKGGLGLVG